VASPFVVAGQLRENGLGHKFVCLVVEMVVQVVAEQTVDQHSLTLKVIAQSCSAQTGVQETGQKYGVKFY